MRDSKQYWNVTAMIHFSKTEVFIVTFMSQLCCSFGSGEDGGRSDNAVCKKKHGSSISISENIRIW